MSASETSDLRCNSCRKPGAPFLCELCSEPTCKNCRHFLVEGSFAYKTHVPNSLKHTHYCGVCYDREVVPALDSYSETLEAAKNALFFFKTQVRPLPVIRRAAEPVRIQECADRDETVLRIGFLAIEAGYNSVIEAELKSEKIRHEGYQKSRWSGHGVPAEIDMVRLERRTDFD